MAANVESGETRYIPTLPPSDVLDNAELRALLRWIKDELDRVSVAISSLEYQYTPMSSPPERYSNGYVAYADGTNWNPGAGEGLYVYKSTGWSLLS